MAKKVGVLLIASMFLVLFSITSYAAESTDLRIDNIRILDPYLTAGQHGVLLLSLTNNLDTRLKDLEVRVILLPGYEIIGRSTSIDIKKGDIENRKLQIDIPSYIDPGYYLIKISVKNSDFKRTKIREIYIQ